MEKTDMKEPVEVVLTVDWSEEKIRMWFMRLRAQVRHPQYQGRIGGPELRRTK